jgi:hypothetical protein
MAYSKYVTIKESRLGVILRSLGGIFVFFFIPIVAWLFSFKKDDNTLSKIIKACIIISLLLFVYKIPYVRDTLTLSTEHTVNVKEKEYKFPDRSYFDPTQEKIVFQIDTITYITYIGYTKGVYTEISENTCYLVPRGEKLSIASKKFPVFASGFEDNVFFTLKESLSTLPYPEKAYEYLLNLSYFQMTSHEIRQIQVTYTRESSWNDLKRAWWKSWSFANGNKPYEIKAKDTEHAIVCF